MPEPLWLELDERGGYVCDASRAIDEYMPEPCRIALTGNGYNLAITQAGFPVAELTLDDNLVVKSTCVYAPPPPHVPEELNAKLKPFIGRKVLYRARNS